MSILVPWRHLGLPRRKVLVTRSGPTFLTNSLTIDEWWETGPEPPAGEMMVFWASVMAEALCIQK